MHLMVMPCLRSCIRCQDQHMGATTAEAATCQLEVHTCGADETADERVVSESGVMTEM